MLTKTKKKKKNAKNLKTANFEKKKRKKNKRPRGLDTPLGQLLVKRIPVMYKLSKKRSLNKSKVDTRSSKLEMHRMTPN